jgi:hypothetical protein
VGKRLAYPAVLAALVSGCGAGTHSSTETSASTTTTTRHVPVSPQPTALTVFRVEAGTLRADAESVPHTTAVAASSLGALGLSAPVQVAGGTATVDLPRASPDEVAEVVYTLTQYRTIERVDVAGRRGLTRNDVSSYVPPILVEAPGAGASVHRSFAVTGTASVFEATLVVELRDGNTVVEKRTVTASEGAPGRGTFETELNAPSTGDYTVAAYSPAAADGTPQHEQDVPVTVTR